MSTSSYIRFPIETNPNQLALDIYAYIQARVPQWEPNDGNLDTWIIQAITTLAAELRELASNVPTDIYRYFGATLMAIPPIDATHSTVSATFTVQDTQGYTIPAGTQVAIRDSAGNLVPFETGAAVVINPGSTTAVISMTSIDPGAETAGLGGVGVAAQLLDTLSYVSSVVLTGATTGGVDAESDDTYLNRLTVALRLLSTRPILPSDFAILTRTSFTEVYRAVAIDGYNPTHNLLTANQASIETDVSGWTAVVNCTIARSTAQAADGVASLALTAAATSGGMNAYQTDTPFVPCTPGETITGLGSSRANTTTRNAHVILDFLDAAKAHIIYATGATTLNSNTGWTNHFVTATAPANAAYVRLVVETTVATVAGEVHYFDKMSIRRGLTTDWVPGGTAETGNPRMVAVAAQDALGNPVSGTVKTAIQTLLQANREVNFIVNMLDQTATQVDVTYQVAAKTGFDKVALKASIDAALASYFSAVTWGNMSNDPQDWTFQNKVYYLEVATLINNVDGVDRITTTGGNYDLQIALHNFTLGRTDVTLPGAVPVPAIGTIVGTVV